MGEEFKVSIHPDRCHLAVSKATAAELNLPSRFLHVWDRRIEMLYGAERAFRQVIPASELHTEAQADETFDSVHWIDRPARGNAVDVSVFIGPRAPDNALCAFERPSGDWTWLNVRELRIAGTPLWRGVKVQKRRMLAGVPTWQLGAFDVASKGTRGSVGFQPRGGSLGLVEVKLRRRAV
jgi:hypothetical protein